MNVKKGDLAYIIGTSQYAGRIVEVIASAPSNKQFVLPDGFSQLPTNYEWVIKFVGAPVEVPISLGQLLSTRLANFACAPDRRLRPITPPSTESETTTEKTLEVV